MMLYTVLVAYGLIGIWIAGADYITPDSETEWWESILLLVMWLPFAMLALGMVLADVARASKEKRATGKSPGRED